MSMQKMALLMILLFSAATRSRALSWKARMKIALGVAYALEYMHSMCSPLVAHGNIKATNILLDAQLMPYLSHCGLGKLSHFVSATRMDSEALSGAKGYAAPEPISPGTDDIKFDIYSFGVILTGQKAFDSSRRQNEQFLVDWASPHLHDLCSLERITDPRTRGSMPSKAISALGKIILLYIKASSRSLPPAVRRPSPAPSFAPTSVGMAPSARRKGPGHRPLVSHGYRLWSLACACDKLVSEPMVGSSDWTGLTD